MLFESKHKRNWMLCNEREGSEVGFRTVVVNLYTPDLFFKHEYHIQIQNILQLVYMRHEHGVIIA